jgi:hypothetical protein
VTLHKLAMVTSTVWEDQNIRMEITLYSGPALGCFEMHALSNAQASAPFSLK